MDTRVATLAATRGHLPLSRHCRWPCPAASGCRVASVRFGKAARSLSPPKRLTQSFYAAIVASLEVVVTSFRHTPFFTAPTAAPSLTAFPQCLRRLRHPCAPTDLRTIDTSSYIESSNPSDKALRVHDIWTETCLLRAGAAISVAIVCSLSLPKDLVIRGLIECSVCSNNERKK